MKKYLLNKSMSNKFIESAKCIFIDFDGVISNSNFLKEKNIFLSASKYIGKKKAGQFAEYFVKHNGIPREIKTFEYFNDRSLSDEILSHYNELNKNLISAPLIPGVKNFITNYSDRKLFVLSGGDQTEISKYLKLHKIETYFENILSGPKTKSENLNNVIVDHPSFFIGDTLYDYKIARTFDLKFVFMYEATQEKDWQNFNFENSVLTKNFLTLDKCIFYESN